MRPMKGQTMKETLVVAAFGSIVLNAASAAYCVYKIHKMQQQVDVELADAKQEINKTVNKFGKVLQAFEL